MVAQTVAREFSKPLPARQIEARSRAKVLRVRVAVLVEARSYTSISQSEPGKTYRIERTRLGWGCECDGFVFTGMCKHLAAVERRSEREGWTFGKVAPRGVEDPGVSATTDTRPALAPIVPFPVGGARRSQSAATRAANDDLFGA